MKKRVAHRGNAFRFYFFRDLHRLRRLNTFRFLSKQCEVTTTNTKPFSVIVLERELYREIFLTVFRFLTFPLLKIRKFYGFWCKKQKIHPFLCGTARAFEIKSENGTK